MSAGFFVVTALFFGAFGNIPLALVLLGIATLFIVPKPGRASVVPTGARKD